MTWLVVGLIQQEDNWTGTDPLRTGFHRFTEIGLMFIINSLCENTLQRTMAGAESSHTLWVCLFSVAYDPYSGYISLGGLFQRAYEITSTTRFPFKDI